MVERNDRFVPVYEEIRKFIKIFPTVINKEEILKMAESVGISGIRADSRLERSFIVGLEKYFRKFKIFAYESEYHKGKPVIEFKKMSEEDEKYLAKIDDVIWILTADLINDIGGIILQRELYERDDIAKALGKIEEYGTITRTLRLYIEEFEPSDLIFDAFNLIDRYRNSFAAILYKKFGKLSEAESKEYVEDTKQLIESRLMPVTKKVEIMKGKKITVVRQSDIEKMALTLKNLLASL